jgi:hypothetical protein
MQVREGRVPSQAWRSDGTWFKLEMVNSMLHMTRVGTRVPSGGLTNDMFSLFW